MKKLSIYLALTVIMTLTASCSGDDSPSSVSSNPQPVIDAATAGEWKITYFYDTDHEETNHFTNFTFTFGSGSVLTATNGTDTYTGTWSVTDSHSGSDDDSGHNSDDLDFNIGFTSPANFIELSDDWDILSYSANKIELIDISGGNGGTDYLTFEKVQ